MSKDVKTAKVRHIITLILTVVRKYLKKNVYGTHVLVVTLVGFENLRIGRIERISSSCIRDSAHLPMAVRLKFVAILWSVDKIVLDVFNCSVFSKRYLCGRQHRHSNVVRFA